MGINISGNAATATNATYASYLGTSSSYYTKSSLDTALAGKAAASHTHSYLPLSGGVLTGKLTISSSDWNNQLHLNRTSSSGSWGPAISFDHDGTCNGTLTMTSNKLYVGDNGTTRAEVSMVGHTHDDRYYTESEIDTKLSSKSDTGHTHSYLPLSGGTVSGTITATGFYQSSDERLKIFYDPIKVDLDKLSKLRKNYFKFNDKDKLEIGVSAQEIQSIYPEIVSTDDNGYLSVAYDKLSVIALAAIDELDNKYKKEINDLKDQLDAIKNILNEKGIL